MIDRTNLFDKLKNGAVWNTGVTFERTNPVPIEKYSIFETLPEAQAYAYTNPVAYPGQTLAVITEDNKITLYMVAATADSADNALVEVGKKTLGDDASISVAEDGTVSVYGFDGAQEGYIPQKVGNKIKWVAISAVVEGDTVTNGDGKSIDTTAADGDAKNLIAKLHGFDAEDTLANYIPYKTAEGTLAWKAEYSYDDSDVKSRLDTVEAKFTGDDAKNALSLGGKAAAEYQIASELKALAKKDKVAETDLAEALATKINGKAEATVVNAIDSRLQKAEGSVKTHDADIAGLKEKDTAIEQKVTALETADFGKQITELDAAYKAADEAIKADVALKAVKTDVDDALKLKANTADVNKELALKATVAAQEATEAKAQGNKEAIAAMDTAYKAADTALDTRLQAAEGKLKDVTNVMDFVGAVDKLPTTKEELAKYQKGDVIVVTGGDEAGLEYVYDGAKFVEIGNSSSEQAAIAELKEKDATHDSLLAGLESNKATKEEVNTLSGKVDKKAEQSALDDATGRITAVEGEVDTLNAKPAFGITSDQISNWDKEVGAKAIADQNKKDLGTLSGTVAANKQAFDTLNDTVTNEVTGLVKKVSDLTTNKADASDLTALTEKVDDPVTGLAATKAIADKNKEDIANINAKDCIGITSTQISNWDNEVGAKAIAEANSAAIAGKEAAGTAAGLIADIVDSTTGTAGASKAITAFDQVGGKVSVTFAPIAITKSQITDLDGSFDAAGAAQEAVDAISGDIGTGIGADSTLATLTQAKGKVTATFKKIAITQDQVSGLPAALVGKVDVVEGSRLMTEDEGQSIADLVALTPAEAGAQANVIEEVKLNGVAASIENKSIDIPAAMADTYGLVKLGAEFGTEKSGELKINSVNVNKLTQTENEWLILNGGDSTVSK